jgi:2-polyprenyl-3-methyl-5-hydroxy-6-metoxy-1,4-benzoquinol methylase
MGLAVGLGAATRVSRPSFIRRAAWRAGLSPQWLLRRRAGRGFDMLEMSEEQARGHQDNPSLDRPDIRRIIRFWHQWLLATLRDRAGSEIRTGRVLDVGDSDGILLRLLGKEGTGVNISSARVAMIEANGVTAAEANAENLPFGDATFDVVLCFETLEHVHSPVRVLTELSRVCRDDGRVFVSVPRVSHSRIQPYVAGKPLGQGHLFELGPDDFAALVSHTPLAVRWSTVCPLVAPPRTPAERIADWLWRDDVVGGVFRALSFYELVPARSA